MAFNTYSDLKAALANWLARSDLDAYYDDFITLGGERLARELRIEAVMRSLSVVMSGGTAVVPDAFTELKYAYLDGTPTYPLEVKDAQWIFRRFPNRVGSGIPEFIAVDGSEFVFGQFPDSDYTVKGKYYYAPDALTPGSPTNAWTSHTPDALLFACLCESAPFLKHDARTQTWEAKYTRVKDGYNRQQRNRARRGATTSYK